MVSFLPYSVESCEGGHGISSEQGEVCPSSPEKERSMTMVICLPFSVESCEGGHGLCHHLLVLRRRGVTMELFFLSSVESCGSGHGISSRKEEVWPSSPKKERSTTMVIFLPSSVESCIYFRGGGREV